MSLLEKYETALENGDVKTLENLLHDEFTFVPHVGDAVMKKSHVLAFAGTGAVRSEGNRILYENDEIGVSHSIVHFTNGSTSEAVLSFVRFKDGKIFSMETGATPLSDDYKLIGSES